VPTGAERSLDYGNAVGVGRFNALENGRAQRDRHELVLVAGAERDPSRLSTRLPVLGLSRVELRLCKSSEKPAVLDVVVPASIQQLERAGEPPDGVYRGERSQCSFARATCEIAGTPRVRSPRRRPVMRKLGEATGTLPAEYLEGLRDPQVRPLPASRPESLSQGVRDEGMHEPESARRLGRLGDERDRRRTLEDLDESILIDLGCGREHVEVELLADDRRSRQDT
jgi:hypothetical protein